MSARTMAQTLALVFGVVFLLVGILGFIPGITADAPGEFAGEDSEAELLGLFGVSILHNIAHMLFGVGILAARTHATAVQYLLWSGVAYGALTLLGFVGGLDWLPANAADDWLHLILTVALLGAWFVSRDEAGRAPARAT
jgi:hypothetical protein